MATTRIIPLHTGKSNHAARSVDDQVVYVKQAVAAWIDKIQAAELGQLEKQREQKR